jgi:phosphatidylglycerophosphate synthase
VPAVPWAPLVVAFAIELLGLAWLGDAGLVGPVAMLLAAVSYLVGAGCVAAYRRGPTLGWANGTTLARVVGVSWIVALTVAAGGPARAPRGELLIILIGAACLLLDGVDGRLARARGEAGPFGARFDMETDAAMLVVLGFSVALLGITGWWVLAIGAMRYLIWVAAVWVKAMRIAVFYSYARKVVAVVQGVALLLCLVLDLTGLGPDWLPSVVAGAALAALAWSFGRDIVWQFRR